MGNYILFGDTLGINEDGVNTILRSGTAIVNIEKGKGEDEIIITTKNRGEYKKYTVSAMTELYEVDVCYSTL